MTELKRTCIAFTAAATVPLLSGCAASPSWDRDSIAYWSDRRWPPELGRRIQDLSEAEEVTVLIFGDSGKRSGLLRTGPWMADRCNGKCDFALMLGDNFYYVGPASVEDERFRTRFREPLRGLGDGFDVWAVPGNHAYLDGPLVAGGDVKAQLEYTYQQPGGTGPDWLMPSPVFQVAALPPWLNIVGFDSEFLIDSRTFHGGAGAHRKAAARYFARIRAMLADGEKQGWRVLFAHHPLISTGKHGEEEDLGLLREYFLAEPDFHVYFAGHDHDQQLLESRGFIQVVQGAASKVRKRLWPAKKRRSAFDELSRLPVMGPGEILATAFCTELGFAIATFRRNELQLRFFIGSDGGREIGRWRWLRRDDGTMIRTDPSEAPAFRNLCP